MWAWTDRIGIIVFDAAFATSVFLTGIVLAMLACRQPVRRILLARVALLASLAIIPLVAWGRLPRLDVIDTFVESRFFPKALFLAAAAVDLPDAISGADAASQGPARLVPEWLLEHVSFARRWLPRGLTLVDLGCVAVGGSWLMLGIAGIHWLISRSRPPSPATRALFEELIAGRSRAAGRAGLRVCARLPHPVVTGWFRPMILIPERLDRPEEDPGPLRLSLLHELAHVERSDHWFSTAASLAQSIWFFLPHVWWIRARLLIDQEFLADRSAAERYGTSCDYASSLLSLAAPAEEAGPLRTDRELAPAPATDRKVGIYSPLFQRMMMLLHCPYPVESRTPRVWSWTSRFAVILTSIAAACLVVRWPQASLAKPTPRVAGALQPRFQARHFVTEPIVENDGHKRSRVYVLPLALPPRFDLDVDVRCKSADPGRICIIGKPIQIPGDPTATESTGLSPPAPADGDTRRWHHLHISRDHDRVSIALDGHAFPDTAHNERIRDWLTIEPPADNAAEFRELVVSW